MKSLDEMLNAPGTATDKKLTLPTRSYLFLLLFLLPVDYFAPSAAVLREAGAKPAIPLMVAASFFFFFQERRRYLLGMDAESFRIYRLLLSIVVLGSLAFGLNLCFSWSFFGGGKDPFGQFLGQGVLFLFLPIIVVTHSEFFRRPGHVMYMIRILPGVTLLHLLGILLEAGGALSPVSLPLSLFRTAEDLAGRQPSGLMTEPSYVGAMAAMFGLSLMLIEKDRTMFRVCLGIVSMIVALLIGAKTIVPVAIAGVFGFMWQARKRIFQAKTFFGLAVVSAVAVYVTINRAALDVSENLSSAMRLGSTVLAIRLALHGYCLTGIGFGQFHFLYRPEFAPQYLLYSSEALDQFSRNAQSRASTYNLFARILVETGALGLGCFLAALVGLFRLARRHQLPSMQFGAILLAASIGFLMTQDPFCYPPLACGMALILSGTRRS